MLARVGLLFVAALALAACGTSKVDRGVAFTGNEPDALVVFGTTSKTSTPWMLQHQWSIYDPATGDFLSRPPDKRFSDALQWCESSVIKLTCSDVSPDIINGTKYALARVKPGHYALSMFRVVGYNRGLEFFWPNANKNMYIVPLSGNDAYSRAPRIEIRAGEVLYAGNTNLSAREHPYFPGDMAPVFVGVEFKPDEAAQFLRTFPGVTAKITLRQVRYRD